MKIGILTFHNAHNYGAVLQAYALKKKLGLMGHEAEIVNYQNKYIARLYRRGLHIDFWKRDVLPQRWPRLVKLAKNQQYGHREWLSQWNAFEDFCAKHLYSAGTGKKPLTVEQLSTLPMDAFVLGSDQIWARELTHGLDAAYFGQFHTEARKISYAASVPNASIPENEQLMFRDYLKDLSAISVREEKLAKSLEELLDREVETVVDPTLLLEKQDYESLVEAPDMAKPYVFAYYVVESKELSETARKVASDMGCTLVELHYARTRELDAQAQADGENVIYIYDAGPSQFLGYIRDAKMVLTNSFHGTVFSILFEKKFYSVYRENGRIENLLGFLGLNERHICTLNEAKPAKEVDYSNTGALLAQYRKQSEEFLIAALEQ